MKLLKHFLRGIARLFDPFGTLSVKRYPFKSDADALKSDWETVGKYFRKIFDEINH